MKYKIFAFEFIFQYFKETNKVNNKVLKALGVLKLLDRGFYEKGSKGRDRRTQGT